MNAFHRFLTRRGLLGAVVATAGSALLATPALAQEDSALERVRARGLLTVALYDDMPPFNVDGKGIDIDLAKALAKALGVKVSLLRFTADESLSDDLRNLVWKGHYLGFGPADVLLHVPVQRQLMDAEDKVTIFAPFFGERLMMARDLKKLPQLQSLADLGEQPVAVAGQSTAGWLLIGTESGRYRQQLHTTFRNGADAARALQRGEVAAAAGQASELQSVLAGQSERYAIEPMPVMMHPGHRRTPVGMAVKRGNEDLARALQAAVNQLVESGEMRRIFAAHQVEWVSP